MLQFPKLKIGDTVGIVAPSRPIINIQKEIKNGIRNLEEMGFKIKFGKNIKNRLFYSAGTPLEKAEDINEMFLDSNVKAIIAATGGSSSNQILEYLNFEMIKNNPKVFIGYSDITTLLLSIYSKTNLITFHGPDVYEFSRITPEAKNFFLGLVCRDIDEVKFPQSMKIWKDGAGEGALLGGNILMSNGLLGSNYFPDYNKVIWFWEAVGLSPAMIDFHLRQFKNSGNLYKISGMIIGYLHDCSDKKYPEDNRPIKDIVLEVTKDYNFPIIKVDYFGHEVNSFYTFPLGINAIVDTYKTKFELLLDKNS